MFLFLVRLFLLDLPGWRFANLEENCCMDNENTLSKLDAYFGVFVMVFVSNLGFTLIALFKVSNDSKFLSSLPSGFAGNKNNR